jgi:hypothetical protein
MTEPATPAKRGAPKIDLTAARAEASRLNEYLPFIMAGAGVLAGVAIGFRIAKLFAGPAPDPIVVKAPCANCEEEKKMRAGRALAVDLAPTTPAPTAPPVAGEPSTEPIPPTFPDPRPEAGQEAPATFSAMAAPPQ